MVQDKLPINILAPAKAKEETKEPVKDSIAEDPYAQFKWSPDVKPMQGPYKTQSVNNRARNAYLYYVNEKGLPKQVAAGIVGNLYHESGLRTDAEEKEHTGNGRGIAQWDVRNRWPALQKWAAKQGKDPMNITTQLDYVLVEPGWGDEALKRTMKATTPEEAAMIFGKFYERPNEKYASWDIRKGAADTLHRIPTI